MFTCQVPCHVHRATPRAEVHLAVRAPIGVSDFVKPRGAGSTRVGKTLLLSTFDAFQQRAEITGRGTAREPVVILIDEHSPPLHSAWARGHDEEVLTFFRGLLSGALKDDRHPFRAVITSVMRIVRESLFSGLNHIKVCTVMHEEHATAFGFTEPEVAGLAAQAGVPEQLGDMRAYYDGCRFSGIAIDNPWSVLRHLESPESGFEPHRAAAVGLTMRLTTRSRTGRSVITAGGQGWDPAGIAS